MSVINTNISAITARNAGAVNERNMTKAMQQLSTGSRINVAADDAAGLAISTKMTSQIRGLNQAIRNANDGIAMLQVVEGATVEMTNMLQRMRELAVQSSNDTNTAAERSYLNDEFQQLFTEIDRIADTTQWNGVNVMDASTGIGAQVTTGIGGRTASFQVGANANADQKISFQIGSYTTAATVGTAAVDAVSSTKSFTFTADGETQLDLATVFKVSDGAGNTYSITNGATTAETLAFTSLRAAAGTDTASLWETAATNLTAALQAVGAPTTMTISSSGSDNLTINDENRLATWTFSAQETAGTDQTYADDTDYVLSSTLGSAGTPATSGSAGVFSTAAFSTSDAAGTGAVNILTKADSDAAISALDRGMLAVNEQRSAMGAVINRLTYAADNLTNTSANVTAARSRVLDTDYAQATTELARTQIIQQASTAMLAQANQGAQSVLSLLK